MGRSVDDATKGERIQIRITKEERERFEAARLAFRPRMQFQEFLLECIDLGLEIQEAEYRSRKSAIESRTGMEAGRRASNE